MQREDFLAALAERGIRGRDAETALDNWRKNPLGSDAIRIQAVLADMAAK